MPVQLSTAHATFEARPKVREATKSFMDTFGFSYFQYLRVFADGSIGLLTTDTGLLEEVGAGVDDEPVVFSSYEEENAKQHTYWFMWDETLPDYPVQLARQKYNIRNGITMLRRHKNYYDMIAVAVNDELANPGTFYLNRMKPIENFITEFDMNNKDLLSIMDKHPIVLPKPYRDANYQKICLTDGRVDVAGKEGVTYVTAQELTCLRYLAQGATYKEIGRLMNVSPRTIETYIQRIKDRTGVHSRADLKQLLMTA